MEIEVDELLADAGCRSWPGEGCQVWSMIGSRLRGVMQGWLAKGSRRARGMMRARPVKGVIKAGSVRREGA